MLLGTHRSPALKRKNVANPFLQKDADHQARDNVGAPVRENGHPRTCYYRPHRTEVPPLLRVIPAQSGHQGADMHGMSGREGVVGLARGFYPLPVRADDDPVGTGPVDHLLD